MLRPLPYFASLGLALLAGCASTLSASSRPDLANGPSPAQSGATATMRMKPADTRAAMPSKWIDHLANGSHSAAPPGGDVGGDL